MRYRRGWVYLLLVTLVTINYMDRSALSIVAKNISGEFSLSPVQLGYLFSSFLWSYVICLLPVGILIDRFSTKSVNSVGIALWSIAIALTAGAWNFASLIGTRMFMGVGESTSIPSCGRIVREWMPAGERGMASTIYSSGSFFGPAIGALIVGSLTSGYGWRASFIVLGALGFIWLVVNLIWFDRPEKVTWLSAEERAKIIAERGARPDDDLSERGSAKVIFALIKKRSIWGIAASQATGIYSLYFLLFWLPSYLQTAKGLSLMKTGVFTAIPWAVAVPLSIGLGALSDRLLSREALLAGKRRSAVAGSLIIAAVILIVPFTDNIGLVLALIAVALAGVATTISLNVALVTDLVQRPSDVGKAISLVVLSGNLFGILSPIITGYIIQGLGGYEWAFVVAGALLILGAVSAVTLTRRPITV
jgi:MFS family permease